MEQRTFPFGPQSVPDPKLIEDWEVKTFQDEKDAIWAMFARARTKRSQSGWANIFNTAKGTFNLWVSKQTGADDRRRNFPTDMLKRAIHETGSMGIVQYLIKGTGYKLVKMTNEERIKEIEADQKARRIEELEQELAQLKGAA